MPKPHLLKVTVSVRTGACALLPPHVSGTGITATKKPICGKRRLLVFSKPFVAVN